MARSNKFRNDVKSVVGNIKPVKKPRKKRELSKEQKDALVERMKKAREARGSTQNLSIDESIRDLPAEHPLHPDKVKAWLKYQKDVFSSLRHMKDSKEASERALYIDTETYIFNLQKYLSDGIYRDHRYGEEKQNFIRQRCVRLAYYPDGTPKRTVGVFYPDIGEEYSKEMEMEDNAIRKDILEQERLRKTNRNYRPKS
jgi:hypothetical protein